MKLENLIEALDSMMNLSEDSIMSIIDEAGNDIWKGSLIKNLGLVVVLLCGLIQML